MGKGYALLMEMGCGKSITTVAVAGRAYLNGFIRKLLIIAPKSILEVWKDEFSKFAEFPYSLSVLQGTREKKIEQLENIAQEGLQVAVMNYDSVARIEASITAWKPDFIVCDESTRIKNPEAKTSKAVHRIARCCQYRMILTGSPITKNPLDLYSQYKMLDESIFGYSFAAFKNRYANFGGFDNPVGFRNLSELTQKAHSIAYRVTKEQALDLPKIIDEIYPVTLEREAYSLYQELVDESERKFQQEEATTANILTTLLRLQQITGGFYKPEESCKCDLYEELKENSQHMFADEPEEVSQHIFHNESEGVQRSQTDEPKAKDNGFIDAWEKDYIRVSRAKLKALEDIVENAVGEGEKLVVMARFIPELGMIAGMLRKKGIKYSMVCGAVKDRTSEIKRFQEDPDCRVFIGQLQTASMGITLTAASTMVFYSLSYNYGDYIQSKARIHRIGQKKPCVYIHLVARGTVDEAIMSSLQNKENIARLVVDRKQLKALFKPKSYEPV